MKKYGLMAFFSILIYVLFLSSCSGNKYDPELLEVEAIIRMKPDSALFMLRKMNTNTYSEQDKALYCLLLTQAEDKCYVEHQSDSLISKSVDYFRHHEDNLHLAKALYIKGRVNYDLGNHAKAAESYVEAKDVAKESGDCNILYLIHFHLGNIYYENNMADRSLETYAKAKRFAELENDSISISYANSYMGRAYALQKDWGKSIESYLHGVEIAERMNHPRSLRLALAELSVIYRQVSEYGKSLDCLQRIRKIPGYSLQDNTSICFKIGDTYRLLGNRDSALWYLGKSLHSNRIYVRSSTYECLTYLYDEQGEHEKAMKYNKLYLSSRDSVQKMQNLQKVANVELQFQNDKMEIKQTQTGRIFIVLLLSLVSLIVIFVILYKKILKKSNDADKVHVQLMKEKEAIIRGNCQNISLLSKKLSEQGRLDKEIKAELEELKEANEKLQEEKEYMSKELEVTQQAWNKLYANGKTLTSEEAIAILKRIRRTKEMTEEDKKNIIPIFQSIDSFFVDQLWRTHPNLKKGEVKICCMLKFGFSLKEIMLVWGISCDAMNKRIQRLKQALGVDNKLKREELENYIRNFPAKK